MHGTADAVSRAWLRPLGRSIDVIGERSIRSGQALIQLHERACRSVLPFAYGAGVDRDVSVLAYEQAYGRLQRQVARLAEGRSMASFLLAATGLVASFLGERALGERGIGTLELLALIALVAGVLSGIRPLRPIPDREPDEISALPVTRVADDQMHLVAWRGNVPVNHVLSLTAETADSDSAYLAVAKELEARARVDAKLLDGRLKWVEACGGLLAVQVVLWSLALA